MNKIEVMVNKKIKKQINNDIIINDYSKMDNISDNTFFIYIPANTNTKLDLMFSNNTGYQKICFLLDDNSNLKLFEYRYSKDENNYEYLFILKNNSKIVVDKFYNCQSIKETVNINLKGINSSIDYNFSTLTKYNQDYIININHYNKNTISNINNRGITNNDANLNFEINGIVKKGVINCVLDQQTKIINMADSNSKIKPNLYIDEYLVEARHGVSIGKFAEDQVFYLQSRGLPLERCYQLLSLGFLLGKFTIDENNKQSLIKIIEEAKNER